MNIEIRNSFTKDADKLPGIFKNQLARIIEQINNADKISEVSACKKLKGFKTAYRIRMGQYRIGFYYENDVVELVRVINRKDIYRYFP